jgi:adenine-specific DNA-methyltransferase
MKSYMLVEQQRQTEQARLDSLKSSAERNELGQFATPYELAVEIAEHLKSFLPNDPIRFIDPAIGTGVFFSALVKTFDSATIERAVGIEIDPSFANMAAKLWRGHKLKVEVGDFTKQKAPGDGERYNLVLTNPPYVRHHHLKIDEKLRLKEIVGQLHGKTVSGLAGLYVYFVLLAHEWMSHDGTACWLIPSEFMDVNYGSILRHYLAHDVSLLQVHRFSAADVQFGDALVTSAIVIFKKQLPSRHHRARFTFGGRIAEPAEEELVSLVTLRASSKWTSFPHRAAVGVRTNPKSVTLGDIFFVKRGLATGSNEFFIIPRSLAAEHSIPATAIRPILPSPRRIKTPVVERNADGWPSLSEQLCLIDSDLLATEIQRKYPGFWEYLESGRRRNLDKGYLTSRRVPWYSQERRQAAPFLCTYMGRNGNGLKPFRFIWNKSDATAANVYLMLYPKSHLQTILNEDPNAAGRIFEALQEIDIANFLGEGRVYGGGLHKIEPKELAALDAWSIVKAVGTKAVKRQLEFSFAEIV